jgi:hypothetical protein
MVVEIPVEIPEPEAQPEAQQEEPEEIVEPIAPRPKRGRPKKVVPPPDSSEPPKPPKPQPKTPVGRPRKNPEETVPKAEDPRSAFRATLDSMSSVDLVRELVTRKRAQELQAKHQLYRSFVM